METQLIKGLIGIVGLVAAMVTIWRLEVDNHDFEEKLSLKIALATLIFSIMMFTPLVDTSGEFIKVGVIALPSLKLVSDTLIMAFMASSLKDVLEREQLLNGEDEEE